MAARQTISSLKQTCESLRLERDALADEVDGLYESLAAARARCRRYESLSAEFEEAAIIADERREAAQAALEDAEWCAEEERRALDGVYTYAVGSMLCLLGSIGGELEKMAEGGADADRLRALADACSLPDGGVLAVAQGACATMPGREEPRRCVDCRWYGHARFARSGCLVGAASGPDGCSTQAYNRACGRFEPWPKSADDFGVRP